MSDIKLENGSAESTTAPAEGTVTDVTPPAQAAPVAEEQAPQPVPTPEAVADESKIFHTKATVLLLDDEAQRALDTFAGKTSGLVLNSPVLVTGIGGEIGAASVYVDGHRIVADIMLNRASPERLDLETKAMPIHAMPLLKEVETTEPLSPVGRQRILVGVELVKHGHIDPRVPPVGE